MSRGFKELLPLSVILLFAAAPAGATIVWGNVAALYNSAGYDTTSSCCQLDAIYDELGLITPYAAGQDWVTYFAGNPLHTDTPINPSGALDGSQDWEWFSANQGANPATATIILDLGAQILIQKFALWNVDVGSLDVNVCTGYSGGAVVTGCTELGGAPFTGLPVNLSGTNYPAVQFSSFAPTTGQYIELGLIGNAASDGSIDSTGQYQVAMGSIAFGTIPEPGSATLIGLGLAAMGFGRWAWQRRSRLS